MNAWESVRCLIVGCSLFLLLFRGGRYQYSLLLQVLFERSVSLARSRRRSCAKQELKFELE